MFAKYREGIKETSTKEVKSLPRLRYSLTSINKIENFIDARSAKLRLAVVNPNYFGDFAKTIRLNHKS